MHLDLSRQVPTDPNGFERARSVSKNLQKLKKVLVDAATQKWITPLKNSQGPAKAAEIPVIVENILDMKNNKTTIIIGTFFKEQGKKPTIL